MSYSKLQNLFVWSCLGLAWYCVDALIINCLEYEIYTGKGYNCFVTFAWKEQKAIILVIEKALTLILFHSCFKGFSLEWKYFCYRHVFDKCLDFKWVFWLCCPHFKDWHKYGVTNIDLVPQVGAMICGCSGKVCKLCHTGIISLQQ